MRRWACLLVIEPLIKVLDIDQKKPRPIVDLAQILLACNPVISPFHQGAWKEPHPSMPSVIGLLTLDLTAVHEAVLCMTHLQCCFTVVQGSLACPKDPAEDPNPWTLPVTILQTSELTEQFCFTMVQIKTCSVRDQSRDPAGTQQKQQT